MRGGCEEDIMGPVQVSQIYVCAGWVIGGRVVPEWVEGKGAVCMCASWVIPWDDGDICVEEACGYLDFK